ncbi:MAG TPA: hypothetical protein VF787_20315, partial [Thermoanaerobaculia bacterium]
KSLYCYYPCGGLLVRAMRWSQTFSAGHSAYISEDENRGAYREGLVYSRSFDQPGGLVVGEAFDGSDASYVEKPNAPVKETHLARLDAVYALTRRPIAGDRSELTHQPYNQYLEGSRGSQGIMQLYFNLSTLGLRGYRAILGWGTLLRARAEEAISLGMSDLRLVTDPALPNDLYASDKRAAIDSAGGSKVSFDEFRPAAAMSVPVAGGRFLRLSAGSCNQLLISYVPAREAKLIATESDEYWSEARGAKEVQRVMRYLWRVNEHLWGEHIYANPHFTYYLGHTSLDLAFPSTSATEVAVRKLAMLLTEWNAWTRGSSDAPNPFFLKLCQYIAASLDREKAGAKLTDNDHIQAYARKFFCHKIIVMHPYTDESLLGDMLRRLAFWGERSVSDVQVSDSTAQFLFPQPPPAPDKKRKKRR